MVIFGSSGGKGELKKSRGELFSGEISLLFGSVAEFSTDFVSFGLVRFFTGEKTGSERTGLTTGFGEVWTLLHPKLTTVFLQRF